MNEKESKNDLPLQLNKMNKREVQNKRMLSEIGESKLYIDLMTELNSLEWEEPIYLDDYDLPTFPTEIYSSVIRDMTNSVADFTQTPPDFAAMVTIGALSTALSKKFLIEPKDGWTEPLNTYTMPLMEPSNRKSSVFKSMMAPIYKHENELIKKREPIIERTNAKLFALDKRIDYLQKAFAKTNDSSTKEEIDEAINAKTKITRLYTPCLVLDDATPEVVVVRLKENNEKISILSAEGDFLENLKGKDVKVDIYLKGHSGDNHRDDRIGRKTEKLDNPLITICIAAQPGILKNLPDFLHDRGFVSRFLFAVPKDFIGYRDPNPPSVPPEVQDKYNKLLTKLMNFESDNPITLHLDAAGRNLLVTLQTEVEKEFREGGVLHDGLNFWGGKLVGQLVRLAGLLHISSHANTAEDINDIPTIISNESLHAAFRLKDYFIAHAEKAFGVMRQNAALTDAKYILEKLLKEGFIISRQAIWQKTKKKFVTAERLDRSFNVLVSRYYIKRVLSGKSGRQEFIYLNPKLWEVKNKCPNSPETSGSNVKSIQTVGSSKYLSIPNDPISSVKKNMQNIFPKDSDSLLQNSKKIVQKL